MRSLLLAGAVLAALSTSAGARTRPLPHPESRDAVATAMPTPPRYTGTGEAGRQTPPLRAPGTTARPFEPTHPSDPPAWPSCPWC